MWSTRDLSRFSVPTSSKPVRPLCMLRHYRAAIHPYITSQLFFFSFASVAAGNRFNIRDLGNEWMWNHCKIYCWKCNKNLKHQMIFFRSTRFGATRCNQAHFVFDFSDISVSTEVEFSSGFWSFNLFLARVKRETCEGNCLLIIIEIASVDNKRIQRGFVIFTRKVWGWNWQKKG